MPSSASSIPLRTEHRVAAWLARENPAVWTVLALFVLVWTAFQVISYGSIDLHPDLVEVYAWGREPSLGYYKHPPLGALMTTAWFAVFPATDWAFHLLAMVNAAVGLFFVDRIARRYLRGEARVLVLLFLLLTPFYQFHGQRFASNQTLLSTWPLATWCFMRAYQTRGVAWSAAAGAAAALAMLGKYYSAFLVAGFVVAAIAHPARWAYVRSAAPWVSVAAGLAVLAPHLVWLVTGGFQPLVYATAVHAGATPWEVTVKNVSYVAGSIAYVALPTVLVLAAARPSCATLRDALWPADPSRRMLVVLLAVPLLLPVMVAYPTGTLLTPLWTMQAWFLLPIALLATPGISVPPRAAVWIAFGVAGYSLAVLLASPAVAWWRHEHPDKEGRAYSRLISAEVTRLWRGLTGRPLRLVAGNADFAAAVSFYSPDHPSMIPSFGFAGAPWATPERRAREGFAAICRTGETECIAEIERIVAQTPGATRVDVGVTRVFWGRAGEPGRFAIGLVPPRK